MPESRTLVNVECPTRDIQRHNRWCFENRCATTDNFEARKDQPTYTRVFDDADQARFFRFDNRIQG